MCCKHCLPATQTGQHLVLLSFDTVRYTAILPMHHYVSAAILWRNMGYGYCLFVVDCCLSVIECCLVFLISCCIDCLLAADLSENATCKCHLVCETFKHYCDMT